MGHIIINIFFHLQQTLQLESKKRKKNTIFRLYVLSQSSERIRHRMKEILHTLQDVEAEMPGDSPVPLQVFYINKQHFLAQVNKPMRSQNICNQVLVTFEISNLATSV